MSEGRTYWYAEDSTYLSRTLVIELGDEFGPAVPGVLQSLKGHAKLQNDGGRVESGLATVSRESFANDHGLCRRILDRAVELGLLDDFEWRDDGRRFKCRLSGWQADQSKGRATQRQAERRAAEPDDEPPREQGVTERDKSPTVTPRNAVKFNGKVVPPARVAVAEQILADFNERAGTSYKPTTKAGKVTEPFRRVLGAVVEHDDIDAALGVRINEAGLSDPWWGDGPAQPGNVWGPNVVDRNRQRALGLGRTRLRPVAHTADDWLLKTARRLAREDQQTGDAA